MAKTTKKKESGYIKSEEKTKLEDGTVLRLIAYANGGFGIGIEGEGKTYGGNTVHRLRNLPFNKEVNAFIGKDVKRAKAVKSAKAKKPSKKASPKKTAKKTAGKSESQNLATLINGLAKKVGKLEKDISDRGI